MMLPYTLLYRLGLTPWERQPVAHGFRDALRAPEALPPGRALDIGCGTGRHAVHLAQRGWRVTGVDLVREALAAARERAAREGVDVEWVEGDAGALDDLGLAPGYNLLYDFNCLHSLPDDARVRVSRALTHLAAPDATLLLTGFVRGHRLLLPRGIDEDEVLGLFGTTWDLLDVRDIADRSTMTFPVRHARPHWYRLALRSTPL
ncbi:class I SAM-dependent methyltransferase [Streptomyces sp. NPDC002004]